MSSRTRDITKFAQFQSESKPTNRLTDIQEIHINLEIVQKYPGNVSRKFQKEISSRNGDIFIFV